VSYLVNNLLYDTCTSGSFYQLQTRIYAEHAPAYTIAANAGVAKALPSGEISPQTETAMKELVEKYRPVRQRTARGEKTKDKAEALPSTGSNKISIKWT